jgi:hypothetical protein
MAWHSHVRAEVRAEMRELGGGAHWNAIVDAAWSERAVRAYKAREDRAWNARSSVWRANVKRWNRDRYARLREVPSIVRGCAVCGREFAINEFIARRPESGWPRACGNACEGVRRRKHPEAGAIAERCGLDLRTVLKRLRRGWSEKEILQTPYGAKRRRGHG